MFLNYFQICLFIFFNNLLKNQEVPIYLDQIEKDSPATIVFDFMNISKGL